MKKIYSIVSLALFCLILTSSAYAGWGATQLEYLDADYPSHEDDAFSPGVADGDNLIQFWSDATYWEKLQVTYEYRSNSQPDWTSFDVQTYSSTGYQTRSLYSGTADVEFRVTFVKVDANSANTITVSWKYYTDN